MPKHPRRQAIPKLDCAEAESLLEAYLDGELAAGRRANLEAHLDGCEGCTDELELARRIRSELHELPLLSCPPQVTRAVFGHADAHPRLGERLRRLGASHRLWQPVLATLVAVALGVGYWRMSSPAPPTPAAGGQETYSAAEIAHAETELKLALAYVGDIGKKARDQFSAEVGDRVVEPMTRSIAGALLPAPATEPGTAEKNGGSPRS